MRAAGRTRTVVTGGAVGRRVGTVGLLVLVAFSGLQCVQDLIVSPPRVKHEFSVSPARDTLPIIGPQDDPIASPFTTALTADGTPVSHALAFTVLQGGSVVQADSAGRLRVVGRGEALLQVRPRNVALPDTLADTVSILGVVPRIGLDPARVIDTLSSIRDTLALKAVALTLRGDTIPNVPIPWQQVSGQSAVVLLDSVAGRVRAEANGVATFRAWVDLVDTVRTVVVWQRPASISVSARTLIFQNTGLTKTATATVRDARGNAIAGAGVQWSSLNPQVASIDPSTGVVTAVRAGQATIVATAGSVTAYGLVTVAATRGTAVNAWVSTGAAGATQLNDVWGGAASDVFAVGANPGVVHYDGSTWSAMSGPAANDTLLGVWGASGSDVFAVGRRGRVLHYGGSGAWSVMTGIDATDHLNAVWGSSPRDVFAAGETSTGAAVVYRYDGAAWGKMTVPSGVGALRALYGFSASNVHATGAGGVVLHYDGTSWAVTLAARTDREGWRLWGTAPNALFASASTSPGRQLVVRRFDGTAWTETSTGIASYQSGLWGSSPSEIYLGTDSSGPFVRYDGSAWALMGGTRGTAMRAVWGTSDGAVWMVGQGGAAYRGVRGATVSVEPGTVAFGALGRTRQLTATVRDGSGSVLAGMPVSWSSTAPASVTVDGSGLASAVATGSATVTATAQGGAAGSAAVSVTPVAVSLAISPVVGFLSSTGATRDLVVTALDSGGVRVLGRFPTWTSLIPGVAPVASPGDTTARVTAVGAGQVTIRADMDALSASALFTTAASGLAPVNVWQVVRPAPDSELTGATFLGAWATSDSLVVFTGDQRSYGFDGAAWREFGAFHGAVTPGVAGVSATRMWAVGGGGALYAYDGTSWSAVSSGTGNSLTALWVASERDVFVGGANATMLRYDGSAWTPMTMPGLEV